MTGGERRATLRRVATGVAVADHHPATGISVLEYLAVLPGHRGAGAGSGGLWSGDSTVDTGGVGV